MFGKLKNILFDLIYFFTIIYLVVFLPIIIGFKPLVVVSGSMEPVLKTGSIMYYHNKKFDEFKANNILVYQLKDHTISHRVYEITESGIITKGDANESYDNYLVQNKQFLGEGTNFCIPFVGYYVDFIYTHKYLLWLSFTLIIIDIIYERKRSDSCEKET